jgi:hypothetical protein
MLRRSLAEATEAVIANPLNRRAFLDAWRLLQAGCWLHTAAQERRCRATQFDTL